MSQSSTDDFNLFDDMSVEEVERFLMDSVDIDSETSDDDHLFVLEDSLEDSIADDNNDFFDSLHLITDEQLQHANTEFTKANLAEVNLAKDSVSTIDLTDSYAASSDTTLSITTNDKNIHSNNIHNSDEPANAVDGDDLFKLDDTFLSSSMHLDAEQSLSTDKMNKQHQSEHLDNPEKKTLNLKQIELTTDAFDDLNNDFIFDDELPRADVNLDTFDSDISHLDTLDLNDANLNNADLDDTRSSEKTHSNIEKTTLQQSQKQSKILPVETSIPTVKTEQPSSEFMEGADVSHEERLEINQAETAKNSSDFDRKTNEINEDMKKFSQKMHEIARHSDEFHNISSKLIEAMRKLQTQEAEDDFSITYEQIYQLRGSMLAARRAFNEVPNFFDLVDQAWENDLYTAQMRQKYKK